MVMGRPNKGVDHVDKCDGSEQSKQRVQRVQRILQAISGERSVKEACEQLGIQRPRFADLRTKALQAAVDALSPVVPAARASIVSVCLSLRKLIALHGAPLVI